MVEMSIKRRCDDLLSVGEKIKDVRQDTRQAVEGGELRFFERRRRNNLESAEFKQFKQVRWGWRVSTDGFLFERACDKECPL